MTEFKERLWNGFKWSLVGAIFLYSTAGIALYLNHKEKNELQNLVNEFPIRAVEAWATELNNNMNLYNLLKDGKNEEAKQALNKYIQDSIESGENYRILFNNANFLNEETKSKASHKIDLYLKMIYREF